MVQLKESFRIKLNGQVDADGQQHTRVPYGIYGLDLSFNEMKLLIALYSVYKKPKADKSLIDFKRKSIYEHLNMDSSNFNKTFKSLFDMNYLFVDDDGDCIINQRLIKEDCEKFQSSNGNKLFGDDALLKDELKLKLKESDLKRYEDLKFIIDNGIGTDKHKAEFAILSDELGYSNNNTLENNFNNTKTEDYVTTIRTDSNTIDTSYDTIDNHITSNEKETEEEISFQDGEDGFGEDRIDDIQEVIEDTSNNINKYKNLCSELTNYQIPNYEDTSNKIEVDNIEENNTNKQMATEDVMKLMIELVKFTDGNTEKEKAEKVKLKVSDWVRRNKENYSNRFYQDLATIEFLKEEIANNKIYDTVYDVKEVKVIEDCSYEETRIRNSNDSYAEALKILINRYSSDNLNEEEITKEFNSFFGAFYEKKSLNDVLFVYEQVRSKYNKNAA